MLLSIQSRSRLFGKTQTLASTPLQNFPNFHFWPNQQIRGFRAESNQVPTGTAALRDAPVRDHWKARQERDGQRGGAREGFGGRDRSFGGERREERGDTNARQGQPFDKWSQNRARPNPNDESDDDVNDSWIDEHDSSSEGESAKKDEWAVGPWNEGQPSLIYECIPGTDLRPVFTKMAKDMNEGTINDTVENRYHYKRSRKLFQRRLFIRRMGWVDNNGYLTKLAKAQKEARDSSKDAKGRVGRDFVVRPLFAYHGKPIIAESSANLGFSGAKGATASSSSGKSQPSVMLDLDEDGEPGSKKLKKNKKKL